MTDYYRVRNWEKFQYREDKKLPWIKTYDAQLDDYEYTSLTTAERGFLHDLRLLANRTNNRIPDDMGYIRKATSCTARGRLVAGWWHVLVRKGYLVRHVSGSLDAANEPLLSAQSASTVRTEVVLDRDRDRDNPLPLTGKSTKRQSRSNPRAVQRRADFVRRGGRDYEELDLREELKRMGADNPETDGLIQEWKALVSKNGATPNEVNVGR